MHKINTLYTNIDCLFASFCQSAMSMPAGAGLPPPGKRKEIYKYEAPWTVYSMNWSIRPDKRFRLALGSFIEEYNNKVTDHVYSSFIKLPVILKSSSSS